MDATAALLLTDSIYWRLRNRRPEIQKYEAYYSGAQSLKFATDEWMKANAARFGSFSDNWCASVANAPAERTKVIGLKLRGDDDTDASKAFQSLASGLWDQWNINDMDAQSSQGFLTSFIDKRSYVLVWRNPGDDDACMTWEHPSNVEIEYDWMNPRKRTAALKTWVDENTEYGTLYTPDYLWKWQRPRSITTLQFLPQSIQMEEIGIGAFSKWEPRINPGEPWPLPNPMGVVPIVEVPNRPLLRGEPVSDIHGVIPMQDAINILWAYLFAAADFASMPARVLLGTSPPMRQVLDNAGNVIGEEAITMEMLDKARIAVFSDENAKIDSWPAATLSTFTDVIEIAVGHIASQTRTPATYLMANKGLSNVSAEGMESSETGLAQKVLEFQTYAGPAMKEVFRLTALAQGNQDLAQQVRLATVQWQNAFIRSPSQQADASLKARQIGYPFNWIMERDGVSPYDQDRINEMVKDEINYPKSQLVAGAIDNPTKSNVPSVVPVV